MATKLIPPLKWHGGKHYLAKRIIGLMPPHVHYVEPYFGGGRVLLAKDPEGVSEVANDIHETLMNFWRVLLVVLNEDAIAVIKSQDGPKTLFYCDPPYLAETRASAGDYQYEMTFDDHRRLLTMLVMIKGKFILSGCRSMLYDGFASDYCWRRKEFDLPNNAAGGKTKRRMIECVWMNY